MIKEYSDIKKYAERYQVNEKDIIFILLNILGANCTESTPRMRMRVALNDSDEEFYFGLPNSKESPFILENSKIKLFTKNVASIKNLENDDCASSYFRKNGTVLTLNTNSRSSCHGCKFCPNNLELNSIDSPLTQKNNLYKHLESKLIDNGYTNFDFVERVTICTGCFGAENKTLQHILLINDVLTDMGYKGTLHYLGSEITSKEALGIIEKRINKFMYTLSVECFSNRNKILKKTKSKITLEQYEELSKDCIDRNFLVNLIYIVGLDSYEVMSENLKRFSLTTNYFPSLNLFQPHTSEHRSLIHYDAKRLDYYLKTRKLVEELYINTSLRPQSWECYRPLWYFNFANENMNCIRI